MKICVTWPAFLLILFLPLSVNGGTIRTSISTSQTVTDQLDIGLECKIRNNGDAMAHQVVVTLIVADLVKSYDRLGDNPVGGELLLKDRLVDPGLKPGKYTAVMRVDFEEENGKSHYAYHFFEIRYRMEKIPVSTLPLFIKTEDPCINKKTFWTRNGSITLSMKNEGKEEIHLNAWLFLSQGFSSLEPNRMLRLSPGETKVEEILVRLEPDGKNHSPYHLIVWCEHHQAHYSWDLKGIIQVEEAPVYFKGYLISGTILLVILFVFLSIRNRPLRIGRR